MKVRARGWFSLLLVLAVGVEVVAPGDVAAKPLSVAECVDIALGGSAKVAESEAKVAQFHARLAEVESVYYPKLSGLAFVAPMYTVRGDIFEYKREWRSLSDWGPYTHLQLLLAQPLYTFGRGEAGADAARAREEVEKARLRETENTVALEVKRLYFGRLLALSLLPMLTDASDTAAKAIARAEQLYDEGTGEVTQSDLMKLHYAHSEVRKAILLAQNGAQMAEAALKHTMGLPDNAPLELADAQLPKMPEQQELQLAQAIAAAAKGRPEWTQLTRGHDAALKLEEAERLANAPVLFLGGTFNGNWTSVRDHSGNPYHYDPYNGITGGVALGLQLNLDPAQAKAKGDSAHALSDEVEALEKFASTGIPLQVKKAHSEVLRDRELVTLSDEGVTATRKWLAFAANAYNSGTGEARDLLEGLVAYLQARRGYYENLHAYYVARAELAYSMGEH